MIASRSRASWLIVAAVACRQHDTGPPTPKPFELATVDQRATAERPPRTVPNGRVELAVDAPGSWVVRPGAAPADPLATFITFTTGDDTVPVEIDQEWFRESLGTLDQRWRETCGGSDKLDVVGTKEVTANRALFVQCTFKFSGPRDQTMVGQHVYSWLDVGGAIIQCHGSPDAGGPLERDVLLRNAAICRSLRAR
jgi:hypothetical protein